jgi:hypothetical protein
VKRNTENTKNKVVVLTGREELPNENEISDGPRRRPSIEADMFLIIENVRENIFVQRNPSRCRNCRPRAHSRRNPPFLHLSGSLGGKDHRLSKVPLRSRSRHQK